MGKHTSRFNYRQRKGRTYVLCTRCSVSLTPAPTSFEEDPLCRECTYHTQPAPTSQRRHFAVLTGALVTAWLATVSLVLGWDGVKTVIRVVWNMISPF